MHKHTDTHIQSTHNINVTDIIHYTHTSTTIQCVHIVQIEELENEVHLLKTELDAEKLKHTKKVTVVDIPVNIM